jgi:hypothetical protein
MNSTNTIRPPVTRRQLEAAYNVPSIPVVKGGEGRGDLTAADVLPNKDKSGTRMISADMAWGIIIASIAWAIVYLATR